MKFKFKLFPLSPFLILFLAIFGGIFFYSRAFSASDKINLGIGVQSTLPPIEKPDFLIQTEVGGRAYFSGDFHKPFLVTIFLTGDINKTIYLSVQDSSLNHWSVSEPLNPGSYYAQIRVEDVYHRISPLSNIKSFSISGYPPPPPPPPPPPIDNCDYVSEIGIFPSEIEMFVSEQADFSGKAYDSKGIEIFDINFAYSTNGGSITEAGHYSAPAEAGNFQILTTACGFSATAEASVKIKEDDDSGTSGGVITPGGEDDTPKPNEEPASTITEKIVDIVKNVSKNVSKSVSEISKNKVVTTTGVAAVAVLTGTTGALSFWGLFAAQIPLKQYLLAILNYLFSFFALRRKNKSGLVFDSTTGSAIAGAMVNLFEFETMKLLASSISDKEGRYNLIAKPGKYVLSVTMGGFNFPSVIAKSRLAYEQDLYLGQTLEIKDEDNLINVKIPIDPTNDFKVAGSMIFKKIFFSPILRLSIVSAGTILAIYALFLRGGLVDFLICWSYLAFWVVEFFIQNREVKFSQVVDGATNKPIDLAIVRVVSEAGKLVKTYVSDFRGRVLPYSPEDGGKILVERVEYKDREIELHKKGFVEKQKFLLYK